MPNNRNRNRNRNRNKRNRNQNKEQQQQQQENPEEEPSTSLTEQHHNDNGNSGNVSNGSTTGSNADSEAINVVAAVDGQQALANTHQQQQAALVTVEADTSAEMGAKNSKHQKEKRVKDEKPEETPAIEKPKAPGSPRQVKVIVHRLVQQEEQPLREKVADSEQELLQQHVEEAARRTQLSDNSNQSNVDKEEDGEEEQQHDKNFTHMLEKTQQQHQEQLVPTQQQQLPLGPQEADTKVINQQQHEEIQQQQQVKEQPQVKLPSVTQQQHVLEQPEVAVKVLVHSVKREEDKETHEQQQHEEILNQNQVKTQQQHVPLEEQHIPINQQHVSEQQTEAVKVIVHSVKQEQDIETYEQQQREEILNQNQFKLQQPQVTQQQHFPKQEQHVPQQQQHVPEAAAKVIVHSVKREEYKKTYEQQQHEEILKQQQVKIQQQPVKEQPQVKQQQQQPITQHVPQQQQHVQPHEEILNQKHFKAQQQHVPHLEQDVPQIQQQFPQRPEVAAKVIVHSIKREQDIETNEQQLHEEILNQKQIKLQQQQVTQQHHIPQQEQHVPQQQQHVSEQQGTAPKVIVHSEKHKETYEQQQHEEIRSQKQIKIQQQQVKEQQQQPITQQQQKVAEQQVTHQQHIPHLEQDVAQQQQQPEEAAKVIVHSIKREQDIETDEQQLHEEISHQKQVKMLQQHVPQQMKHVPPPQQHVSDQQETAAKVIVHSIQREEDQETQPQQQQQANIPPLEIRQQQQQHEELLQQQLSQQQSPPLQRSTKVIIHKIRLETQEEAFERKGKPTIEEISSTTATALPSTTTTTLSPPPRYLVESPSPKNINNKQFTKFARDVQIQEMEQSNSDCSSGEFNVWPSPLISEADSETEGGSTPTPTPTQTSSTDLPSISRAEQQEQLRQKRAQKRNALETHFLPQLISPRYLDSILEENSSEALGEQQSKLPSNCKSLKGQEMYPKSQLDFSRRHKRREEPVALMLETKLLEEPTDLESCTRLQSALSPQSEDAEMVYLSSSNSSSMSDLMELELEEAAALTERTLVDLDTDASKLIRKPDEEMSSTSTNTEPATSSNEETEVETENEREKTPVNREEEEDNADVADAAARVSFDTASKLTATREEFIRNMDKVRELIEMTRREKDTPGSPPLNRQESWESHGSDSTQHSQCTAINLASPPTPPLRQQPPPPPVPPPPRNISISEEDPIKKLRLLCTETLASLPYGEQMLEELAQVAQNINKMPYPRPDLPNIQELQLATEGKETISSSAWLGVPTQSDPQLLVCLSPAQRLMVKEPQPAQLEQLMENHQKFVERRGYHELTKSQVEQVEQEQQILKNLNKMRELRKSLTPTPPPVPVKSAETAAKANAKRDDDATKENKSNEQTQQSISSKMTSQSITSSHKFPSLKEGDLRRMFPNETDIFAEQRKRFSNIENGHSQKGDHTKRYSNIETTSFESQKLTENGQVTYDMTKSSQEKQEEGTPPPIPPPPMMSDTKLNGLNKNSSATTTSTNSGNTYEECRQRAKEALDALNPKSKPGLGLVEQNVFKDFDQLSQQLTSELKTSRERREKSASLYDLSGLEGQKRQAHLKELEREIERSAKSRQERLSSVPRQSFDIPIDLEPRSRRAESLCNLNERPHTSTGLYHAKEDDWSKYSADLGYSENIARPFAKEVEICYQRQNSGIRAPRLSASTNDLSINLQPSFDSFNAYGGRRTQAPMLNQAPPNQQQQRPYYGSCYSLIERNPNPTYISTTSRRAAAPPPPAYDRQQRRSSLPRELHEQQLNYILSKENELKLEVERLQQERRRLLEEMQRNPVLPPPPRRESYRSAHKLPTLSEDEVFRQQMAEEWMHKVAEREERRQHKIIKISKIEQEPEHPSVEQANISDEFLHRVKERRHKLAMPADSDWESGAESQPQASNTNESDKEAEPMRILEGQTEAKLNHLPQHLREFAKFSLNEQLPDGGHLARQEQQESQEDFTDNSHSKASKKTSIVKTFKMSRLPPSVQAHDDETASNSKYHNTTTNQPFDFNGNFNELFARSPFRSKILEEFDKYWQHFEHSTTNSF